MNRWVAVLLAVLGLFAAQVAHATAAPGLDSGPAFAAQFGLDASSQPPIRFVEGIDAHYTGSANFVGQAGALEVLVVDRKDDPRLTPHTILHETLHYASFWRLAKAKLLTEREYDEPWMLLYEEGLVEATTDSLFRGWWRWLTGRKLDPEWLPNGAYPDQTKTWKIAAKKATGYGWRKRPARDWLVQALAAAPAEREALLQEALAR